MRLWHITFSGSTKGLNVKLGVQRVCGTMRSMTIYLLWPRREGGIINGLWHPSLYQRPPSGVRMHQIRFFLLRGAGPQKGAHDAPLTLIIGYGVGNDDEATEVEQNRNKWMRQSDEACWRRAMKQANEQPQPVAGLSFRRCSRSAGVEPSRTRRRCIDPWA